MKKTITLILLSFLLAFAGQAQAQTAAFKQAVSRYATAKSASAKATMTKHSKAMKNDKTYTGTLTMTAPNKVAISCNGGKEQLIMDGNTFTMVQGGKKRVASAKTAEQFAAFKTVLLSVLNGGKTDISHVQGVKVETQGGNVVVTMTPAKQKRMMFTSFVLVINRKTGALETLSLNNKQGYTKYTFTNFKWS